MRIAVDAMGGDHAPEPIVQGALNALSDDPDLHVTLVGLADRLEPLADAGCAEDAERLSVVHAAEVVGMDESPSKALRAKPDSSINRCWRLLSEGQVDGIVSAGNTGAVVAGGLRTRRFLKNIQRPGIAVTIPTTSGWSVMIDVGANVHPKPEHLFQYALMGSIFARRLLSRDKPTIGLMNIGTEESKGNALAKETAALFSQSSIAGQFVGNIEGRDVCGGEVDVIVCDGFVGNVVLKTCEGMVDFLMKAVGQVLINNLRAERDIAKQALTGLHNRYHHSEFGGAPLLGIDGVCLICHGSSGARAIRNAVKAAQKYADVNELIVRELV